MSRLSAYATEVDFHFAAGNWPVVMTMAEEAKHIFPGAMDWQALADHAAEQQRNLTAVRTLMAKLRELDAADAARDAAAAAR